MIEVRTYLPVELNNLVNMRTKCLGLSKSEYFRMLANLDVSSQQYQELVQRMDLLCKQINSLKLKLCKDSKFLHDISIIGLNK